MDIPPEITFRNVPRTEEVERLINKKIDKLEKICTRITSCRVAVEMPQKHQRRGNPYRIRVEVNVPPGHEVVVKKGAGEGNMHDPLPVMIRDAFDAVSRRLREISKRRRGKVKTHPHQKVNAFVSKLFFEGGYGFIRTVDDREIYFHKNSVLNNDFERLEIGTGIRFTEEMGEKGPQAISVQIQDKPGSRLLEKDKSG